MSNLLIYAFFALPLSFIGIPLYIYLPDFYSTTLGVPLATIGVIVLITRIFDTITDPFCGYIGDRFAKHRKKIICFSAIILGLCFYFLFNPFLENKTLNLIFFSVITYFLFSLVTINHLSLISTFENKVLASSLREIFTVLGLLLATVLPSILMLRYSNFVTFKIIGIVVLALFLSCGFLFLRFTNVEPYPKSSKFSLPKITDSILCKYFCLLFINGMAIATPSTLVIFYIKNFLSLEKYTGIFLGTYFISAIVFIPVWKNLCSSLGPFRLFQVGVIGSILTFCLCYFVRSGDLAFYLAICFFSGIFFGVDLIAPTLITNSIIEKKNLESDRTFIFGMTHFISKSSIALISGVILIFLGSKTGNNYKEYLHILYTIIPCILKIIALYIIFIIRNI